MMGDAMAFSNPFDFMSLPPEIRLQIYSHLLNPADNIQPHPTHDDCETYHFENLLNLLLTSRTVSDEVARLFYSKNTFVRVETPWEEAQNHIEEQGLIPLICVGEKAERFQRYHLGLEIRCPAYENHMMRHRMGIETHIEPPPSMEFQMPTCKVVILLEHLSAFCRIWFYSDISNPGGLNGHLDLTVHLQNPNATGGVEANAPVPKALQQKLLSPLGAVRGLAEIKFQGEVYKSIEQAVRQEMMKPYVSQEDCLEQSVALKKRGDEVLKDGKTREAIEIYEKAFYAIHITCKGRRRHIWGDAFFDKQLASGTYEGQHGEWIRIMLRLKLVSQVVLAYSTLKEYEEAEFWGMRTIYIMRQRMGVEDDEDTPLIGFPSAGDIGRIYFRTGVAMKEQAKLEDARKLLKVAHDYLPEDQEVIAALRSIGWTPGLTRPF
ncbi:hypothetical protein P152DRAFT_116267 [Eremomyces bilateralis CBS 781.70]|uniref:Uncharacterized protein n=1 Tax=Eremomyces bilateralis CBS 781.70 TaxID=1392243 RepID=A0A6G1GE05_9PEZI|nr:uncharacterized protein P152DRAFT_116267 [Eremomyces bilateralis CBS 781.70]KAF1816262.1 hypothetical protein P152DRAFT_116267 [Eremomyces bilateralis CBS 781.70]